MYKNVLKEEFKRTSACGIQRLFKVFTDPKWDVGLTLISGFSNHTASGRRCSLGFSNVAIISLNPTV